MGKTMFGQIIIGPPGSGKTTYCAGIYHLLCLKGRKPAIINLDPANETSLYTANLDITDLICLSDVQKNRRLGPNGGILYCLDYLAKNLSWFDERLEKLQTDYKHFVFDCPGQVELFTVHGSFATIVEHLTRICKLHLSAVHLVDSNLCTDASKFIGAILLSLSSMLHLEIPHINVLTKVAITEQTREENAFTWEPYTSLEDFSLILGQLAFSGIFSRLFLKLSAGILDVVEGFGLVSFIPLDIQSKHLLLRVLEAVDTANGYSYVSRK